MDNNSPCCHYESLKLSVHFRLLIVIRTAQELFVGGGKLRLVTIVRYNRIYIIQTINTFCQKIILKSP